MNILVLAPHPDDECIGCGGTLALHARRGDRVRVAFLTSAEVGLKHLKPEEAWSIREAEARKACRLLKAAAVDFLRLPDWFLGEHIASAAGRVLPLIEEWRPELIYLPHELEWHPDHKATLPIVRSALGEYSKQPGQRYCPVLRTYEVWTPMLEHTHAENITATMDVKLRALKQHVSQIKGPYDYVRAIRGLNTFRGVMGARCRFAEVFSDLPGTRE